MNRLTTSKRVRRVALVLASMLGIGVLMGFTLSSAEAATPTTPQSCVTASQATQTLKSKSHGADVTTLQDCLTALGYLPGASDGSYGGSTEQAVVAVQKNGNLGRDGQVGPKTRAYLATATHVVMPAGCRKTDVGCATLSKQLAFVRINGEVRALDASTAGDYTYTTKQGTTVRATTPLGHATICRKIPGKHVSSSVNGTMYDSSYLNYGKGCTGVAFHGEPSVPAYPASHGCIRLPMPDRKAVYKVLVMGAKVSVVK